MAEQHSETRKALWEQRAINLFRAQELDSEIELLRARIEHAGFEAAEARRRADALKSAAEILAGAS